MQRLNVAACVVFTSVLVVLPVRAQTNSSVPAPTSPAPPANSAPQIAPNAPRMSKQTRLEIIRDFETQIVYSRTLFPMGYKGLQLHDGTVTPNGQDLQQLLALWGPSIRPGDPAHISYVHIKDDHIHFDLNGGPSIVRSGINTSRSPEAVERPYPLQRPVSRQSARQLPRHLFR